MYKSILVLIAFGFCDPCVAMSANEASSDAALRSHSASVSAAQLLTLAEKEIEVGNVVAAKTIYGALESDPNVAIRSEARFRHAQILIREKHLNEAALLYRKILDEQPEAQRVRLELAELLARMNDLSGARRLLRQAQAGGLPQDIARAVNQYAAALRSQKPITASFEVAVAPSTNINRATSATTLDTVLAPFQLSDDARAKSGLGLRIGGQTTARLPVASTLKLMMVISGHGSFFRQSSFNDMRASSQIGAEVQIGALRLQPLIGRNWRWYGGERFARTDAVSVNVIKPVGKRAQIDATARVGRSSYRLNDFQNGATYDASATLERALSARAGGSATMFFERQDARVSGYATTAGGMQMLGWRDVGRSSLYLTAGLSRLVADDRIYLFRKPRREWLLRATAGGVFRALTVQHFAPLVRLSYERNQSTVGIYDYQRLGAEIGISRAF